MVKQSGPSGRKPPAYVTFTNQLKPEFWPGWDAALILAGNVSPIGEEIVRRYEEAGGQCEGLWIVKHDRDRLADGGHKDDHVHVVLQQGTGSTRTEGRLQCGQIDAAMGWSKSIVRAPGRGGRIENAQSYLIHAKDPDKFRYAVSDVVTIRGQAYAEIEESHRDAWARRRVMGRQVAVSAREWAELGDVLVQRVLDGEVDELDLLNDKTLMDIYTRNESKVNLALNMRARRDMMREVEKLRAGEFQKTIVWAMGASDQGKTWLVESIAAELKRLLGWDVYRAAARNGLDDYRGEPVIMLNEPSSRVLEWSDLLQLLGPREAGPISARFANKGDAAPRVVLVAVSVDPETFGFFVPGKRSTSDSVDQLVRRLSLLVEAVKVDDEPRYSVGPVALLPVPVRRAIDVPKGDREVIEVAHGREPAMTVLGLDRAEAVGVVVGEVAARSPDVVLAVEDGRTLIGQIVAGALTEREETQIEDAVRQRDDTERHVEAALEWLDRGEVERADEVLRAECSGEDWCVAEIVNPGARL